jgi:predicted nucleotidyltransferase
VIAMNSRDLNIARNFKQLVQQRVTPLDVMVFGSRARGDASTDSDLDVFVVVEDATRDIEKYVCDCAWEAGFEQDVVIVPVVVSQDKIKGTLKESVFILNVYREGITV